MSILTRTQLLTNAGVIKNNTTAGSNTATLVGGFLEDAISNGVYTSKVSLSSAEILQLNSTPKVLVAAQGAGTIILPLGISYKLTWNSIAYITNLNLRVRMGGNLAQNSGLLGLSGDAYSLQSLTGGVISSDISNTDLTLDVGTGNPAAGNSTLDVYITYCVFNV